MGDTEGWEEAIDVDDSDLPSLLRPLPTSSSSELPTLPLSLLPLRPCFRLPRPSQTLAGAGAGAAPQPSFLAPEAEEEAPPPRNTTSLSLIPGPAGSIQAAMHRKSAVAVSAAAHSGSYFEGRDGQIVDMIEEDRDFKINPWLCAMHFLGLGTNSSLPSPITSITTRPSNIERVPQVVGIVNSCAPNGLGDLFITLKDPTGTIGASIHRKVISKSNLNGDISVGCALILKQVVVFCPTRSTRYLNVMPNNVVKLISKDCGPPHKQMLPSLASRCSTFEAAKKVPLVRQMAVSADDEARRNLNFERIRSGGSLPGDESAAPVTTNMTANFMTGEQMEVGVGVAERAPSKRHRADTTADDVTRGSLNCVRTMDGVEPTHTGSSACSSTGIAAKPDLRTSEPKKLVSKVSAAQWTDEQLLELFTDYQDDVEFVHHGI